MSQLKPAQPFVNNQPKAGPDYRVWWSGLPLPRTPVVVLGGAALLLITVVLSHKPVLQGLGDFLVVNEENLQPADVIHPLAGNLVRVDYAVDLYQQGYSRQIFLTGCSCQENHARAIIAQGANLAEVIRGVAWSTNTYEEATELKAFLDNNPTVQSVIIVSSPYHMRRASWIFNKVLGNSVSVQFAAVPFEQSSHRQQWWTDAGSAKMVMSEYVKNLFYHFKYGGLS